MHRQMHHRLVLCSDRLHMPNACPIDRDDHHAAVLTLPCTVYRHCSSPQQPLESGRFDMQLLGCMSADKAGQKQATHGAGAMKLMSVSPKSFIRCLLFSAILAARCLSISSMLPSPWSAMAHRPWRLLVHAA